MRVLCAAVTMAGCLFFWSYSVSQGQVAGSTPPAASTIPPEIQNLQSEWQKLQSNLAAQREAQETVKVYIEFLAGAVTIVSFLALLLQIIALRADARSRTQSRDESTKQNVREDELNRRFMSVLDIATKSAEEAQRKVQNLEEGGIKKAGETLQLINSLLAITERTAAKAAGAQFEFLSRSINNLNDDCTKLVVEAKQEDERDIVGKPEFSERVRVLTKQIESLDHQITLYNESVPQQLASRQHESEATGTNGAISRWARLSLTGPCLFIRGLNNHVDQNFTAAISDWKSSLKVEGASAIKVDANYWMGYVENTLGRFDEARGYFKEAQRGAPEQRAPELTRLDIEARFFALDRTMVPASLIDEGEAYLQTLSADRVPGRAISSFATTMGNICMIQNVRAALSLGSPHFSFPTDSTRWFDEALKVTVKSRWARFGKCQNIILAEQELDQEARDDVQDVIRSVNNEYQNRIEDRSKALSKVTEYMCMIMLGRQDDRSMNTIAGLVEQHSGRVTARTMYSQFRKQNVSKEVFLNEFRFLQSSANVKDTFRMANQDSRRVAQRRAE